MWEKIIAGVLVLMGAQGYGVALSHEMKCYLYHMNEQKQMLFYIRKEISFLHKPMQEIFFSVAERMQKPYDSFLQRVAERMEDGSGKSLPDIWAEEIEGLYKNECYPKKAFFYMTHMKRCFRCEDDNMQKESFHMLSHELEEEMDKLKKSKNEKERLIRTLSLLAGILCIIIFV